jgi:hypothetical protein
MAVTAVLVASLFAFLHTGELPFDSTLQSMILMTASTPANLYNGSHYSFGRYTSPVRNPTLRDLNIVEHTFQKKEWFFTAISDGRWLFGLATADLGYVETGFIYFFDKHTVLHDHWQFYLPGFVNG